MYLLFYLEYFCNCRVLCVFQRVTPMLVLVHVDHHGQNDTLITNLLRHVESLLLAICAYICNLYSVGVCICVCVHTYKHLHIHIYIYFIFF